MLPPLFDDEDALTSAIVDLVSRYGRYGYRRVTALLHAEGWRANHKRVARSWRRESLKIPSRQPRRGRLWLNNGSCLWSRQRYRHHVWAYDFVQDRTHDGRKLRLLTVIDEYSRECLAIRTARRFHAQDVLEAMADLFEQHEPPAHIRSDNGPEFVAGALRDWLARLNFRTLFIEPGSPCRLPASRRRAAAP